MPRQYLVNSAQKEAVQAVARSLGASCVARSFGAPELERLKTPILIVFDSSRGEGLTPERLQSLRRTMRNGVRYSPVVVLCDRAAEIKEWRAAGAVAIARNADKKALKAAIEEALDGLKRWVTAASYVGPCRRRHQAILQWRTRRTADRAEEKARAKSAEPAAPARVSSLSVVHRRLSLSVTLLSGSNIETRRAFRDLAAEAHASVLAQRRSDLVPITQGLRAEAEGFLQNAQRDSAKAESLIREFGAQIGRALNA